MSVALNTVGDSSEKVQATLAATLEGLGAGTYWLCVRCDDAGAAAMLYVDKPVQMV